FKRYAKDLGVFGWRIFVQLWQLRLRPGQTERAQPSTSCLGQNRQHIALPECFGAEAARECMSLVDQIVADCRPCLLELDQVKFIDSTGVGWLVRLQKRMRPLGQELVLIAPSPKVRRALALMKLESFFASVPDLTSAEHLIHARAREQFNTVRLRDSD